MEQRLNRSWDKNTCIIIYYVDVNMDESNEEESLICHKMSTNVLPMCDLNVVGQRRLP